MPLKLHKDEHTTDSKSNLLKGLNPRQEEAVTSTDGPLLIIAGAGSGKTRVLTYRIAYLMQNGVHPSEILALTFTNKAAKEMKQRISTLVSPEGASRIYAGTFHSIFARLLRQNADKLGYTGDFSIYDSDDSQSAIKSIMNDMKISREQVTPAVIQSRISFAKNHLIGWQEFSNKASSPIDRIAAKIYAEYDKKLMKCNAMDFDDLLLNMINLLKSSQDTLESYQNRFQYILVDEYQDTNRSQYISINLLAEKNKNICVVGDDAQSIYRWRGAEIRNILDFQKDYHEAKLVRLEQNYRSTKNILSAADAVIKFNHNQIPKKLWTENEDGELIHIQKCPDDRDEANFVVSIIQKQNNGNYSDYAVLYRTNAQSLPFENSLRSKNIPYIIVGGISFYKRKEIKDTVSYFKLLINPNDDESLLRVINEPPRGIGKVTIDRFREYATKNSISLIQAFSEADRISDLQSRFKNAALRFTEMISKFSNLLLNDNSTNVLTDYLEEIGLIRFYSEIDTEESQDRVRNIGQLINDLTRYYSQNEEPTLSDYLQQITLITDADEKDISQNKVTLMTLHSAKGLEFPTVFICGMEQGLFPLSHAENVPEEEEEERRLFYVGITRAKKLLYLTYAINRMRFGEVSRQTKSRFLSHIPSKLIRSEFPIVENNFLSDNQINQFKTNSNTSLKQILPKTTVFDDIPRLGASKNEYSQLNDVNEFEVGDQVQHKLFGKGKIIAISGSKANIQATVHFKGIGNKKLMLQYANLDKI